MRTRFAPSPTGPLHLGHAYSALLAYDLAQNSNGTFLLRIEDIDRSRARQEWEDQIYDDLAWLGLRWETPVMRQSERQNAYDAALDHLWAEGVLYPCTCRRRDILEAVSAPQEGDVLSGPDGIVYPGTCRPSSAPGGPRPKESALRLNVSSALEKVALGQAHVSASNENPSTFATFNELGHGPRGQHGAIPVSKQQLIDAVGDVVLARRDMGTSYHLSVVIDDAFQDVTHVVRGEDLFEATQIHILLQRLLGVNTPDYQHHGLIRDDDGKRLAKRHDSKAIRVFRDEGYTPESIRELIGL